MENQKMKKMNEKLTIGVSLAVFIIIGIVAFMNLGGNRDIGGITTYLDEKIPVFKESPFPVKIILEKTAPTSYALFDIILTLPEKSQIVSPGENLLVSIELINFGEAGQINVSLSYIITSPEGDIVLIEHEKRFVNTQASFLKEIKLPELRYGDYKLFVEMLYSNTSAIAIEEFRYIT